MNAAHSPVDSLLEAVQRLSNRERGDFLDRFLALNDEPEDADEEATLSDEWKTEIERRIADDKAGLTTWHTIEDVLAEARESLQRPA